MAAHVPLGVALRMPMARSCSRRTNFGSYADLAVLVLAWRGDFGPIIYRGVGSTSPFKRSWLEDVMRVRFFLAEQSAYSPFNARVERRWRIQHGRGNIGRVTVGRRSTETRERERT